MCFLRTYVCTDRVEAATEVVFVAQAVSAMQKRHAGAVAQSFGGLSCYSSVRTAATIERSLFFLRVTNEGTVDGVQYEKEVAPPQWDHWENKEKCQESPDLQRVHLSKLSFYRTKR